MTSTGIHRCYLNPYTGLIDDLVFSAAESPQQTVPIQAMQQLFLPLSGSSDSINSDHINSRG
jgi:hypothetical protein